MYQVTTYAFGTTTVRFTFLTERQVKLALNYLCPTHTGFDFSLAGDAQVALLSSPIRIFKKVVGYRRALTSLKYEFPKHLEYHRIANVWFLEDELSMLVPQLYNSLAFQLCKFEAGNFRFFPKYHLSEKQQLNFFRAPGSAAAEDPSIVCRLRNRNTRIHPFHRVLPSTLKGMKEFFLLQKDHF